jgi:hypothetical protein
MEDNRDIAFLAASCDREMRQTLAGSGLRYNRTDFRKFLQNEGNGGYVQQPDFNQQQAYHQPQYHPQQYQQPYQQQAPAQMQYNNIPVEPNIPAGVLPPPNATFIPMPNGYGQQPQQPLTTNLESTGGFEIPDYNRTSKTYLEDEKQFRDALITEIKALKNNIKAQKTQLNKLTKTVESLTLLLSKDTTLEPSTEEEIIDDNSDQS